MYLEWNPIKLEGFIQDCCIRIITIELLAKGPYQDSTKMDFTKYEFMDNRLPWLLTMATKWELIGDMAIKIFSSERVIASTLFKYVARSISKFNPRTNIWDYPIQVVICSNKLQDVFWPKLENSLRTSIKQQKFQPGPSSLL